LSAYWILTLKKGVMDVYEIQLFKYTWMF